MPYVKGDNWVICDLSGMKVLMSQTKKTWDGLRVHKDWWERKHPQLSIRAIPDRQAVYDGRPRPADVFASSPYGVGSWTLQSPNTTIYSITISDAGSFVIEEAAYQPYVSPVYLDSHTIQIDNSKNLTATAANQTGPSVWTMVSPNGTLYNITIVGDIITVVAG